MIGALLLGMAIFSVFFFLGLVLGFALAKLDSERIENKRFRLSNEYKGGDR